MIHILLGPDDFSLARALEEIKRETGDAVGVGLSTTTLDGRQVTPEQLKTVCETAPFLTGKRLVIAEGLLERFEPRNEPNRQRREQRAGSQPDRYKQFCASIDRMPASTVLVLVEGGTSSTNPLFKELAGKATVRKFPWLKEPQLREWVQKRVVAEGGSISSRAVALLARLVGSNLWAMTGEINKLVLFAGGRRIEEEDVKTIVGYVQEASVFAMVDAILEQKAELAEQTLQQILRGGAAPSYLLSMLARQVRLIFRAGELRKQRRTNPEIQDKLGLTSDFALRKTLEQAGRYSLPRLRDVYRCLLETDISIKTGKCDAELALTILVAELSRRGGTRPEQSAPG